MSIVARSFVRDAVLPFSLAALAIGRPLATFNSPSDFNSVSSFVSSLLGPGSERPGRSIPSSSSVWFILKQDLSFGSSVNLFSCFCVMCLKER